jgi:adenylate cyclase
MKKILALIIFLCPFQQYSFSQNQHRADSLLTILKTAKKDTAKAKILNKLSVAYQDQDPEKAMDYATQALSLSEQLGFKKGICDAYNSMGATNIKTRNFASSLEFLQKSLKVSKEIGYKQGLAVSYHNIGNVYYYQGNFSEALKNYNNSIPYKKELGDKQGLASSLNCIGNLFLNQGNYPEGLKNLFAALKIQEEIGDKIGIADSYTNIGTIYYRQGNYPDALKNHYYAQKIYEELGDKQGIAASFINIGIIYKNQGNYPEALKCYFSVLKICEETGDKYGIAMSRTNIGNIYFNQGNSREALKQYLTSMKMREEIGDKKGIAGTCANIGIIYLKEKKIPEAYQFLNKALSLSKEVGSLDITQICYDNLAILDSVHGNYQQALAHYKLFIAVRDSMLNEENTRKTVQTQMQYEFDKKETTAKAEQEKKDVIALKELQRQKLVRNGFIGGFGVVLIFAFIFFRQRNKIGREKKVSEEERSRAEAEKKRAESERERSEELLLNILPAEVAVELKETGHCQAKTFSMVTVMFMDFKDFTAVSERVSAELLVDEINACFSAFDGIIQKYKVEKIKTVGDAYICAGGLPSLNLTHALDIVNTALEIQEFMLARKKEKEGNGGFTFDMRIGIHTGPVVAGIVGVKKFQYDIWGDTVNLAARMEQNSEAGKTNISGSTYKLVKDKFNCTYRGKIEAKNKGEVEMYFVENSSLQIRQTR